MFGLGTSMLEVSSSKPLASESKGFAFWVELVAPGLLSAGYLSSYCELLHRSGGFTLCAPKGQRLRVSLVIKNK
uniref:Putative ovule protein n=1 Tax=Solanum chacoense TaxID=4108 RepID=A0A0V0HDB1_SOLCH